MSNEKSNADLLNKGGVVRKRGGVSTGESCVRCYSVTDPQLHAQGFTIYKVTQQTMCISALEQDVQEVCVWRRFNDFRQLYKEMSRLHSRLHRKEQFPDFSKPQLFNRFEPAVIEERMRSSQDLLNFIGQRHYLINSAAFRKFFENAEPVVSSTSKLDSVLLPFTDLSHDPPPGTDPVPPTSSSADRLVPGTQASRSVSPALSLEARVSSPDSFDEITLNDESWLSHPLQDEESCSADGLDDDDEDLQHSDISPQIPIPSSQITSSGSLASPQIPSTVPTQVPLPHHSTLSHTPDPAVLPLDSTELAGFDPMCGDFNVVAALPDVTTSGDIEASEISNNPSASNVWLLSMLTDNNMLPTVSENPNVQSSDMGFNGDGSTVDSKPCSLGRGGGMVVGRRVSKSSEFAADVADILESREERSGSISSPHRLSDRKQSVDLGQVKETRSGGVVQSGKGDLTESPFHSTSTDVTVPDCVPESTDTFSGLVNIEPKVLGTMPGVIGSAPRAPGTMPDRRRYTAQNSLTVWEGGTCNAEYIMDASRLICQAVEFEQIEEYSVAFAQYKCAISLLLKGVQTDDDAVRRDAVRKKTARYLMKAEELYHAHLAPQGGDLSPGAPRRLWQGPADSSLALLQGSTPELSRYKVLGLLGRVLLVLDTRSPDGTTYVIKVLHKTCKTPRPAETPRPSDPSDPRPIVPTHIPYMVGLIQFFETDHAIYLLLQHATGGTLWDYVNSCVKPGRDNSSSGKPILVEKPDVGKSSGSNVPVGSEILGNQNKKSNNAQEIDNNAHNKEHSGVVFKRTSRQFSNNSDKTTRPQSSTVSGILSQDSKSNVTSNDNVGGQGHSQPAADGLTDDLNSKFSDNLSRVRPALNCFSIASIDSDTSRPSLTSQPNTPNDTNSVRKTSQSVLTESQSMLTESTAEIEEPSIYDRRKPDTDTDDDDDDDDDVSCDSGSYNIDTSTVQASTLPLPAPSPHPSPNSLTLDESHTSAQTSLRHTVSDHLLSAMTSPTSRRRLMSKSFAELDLAGGLSGGRGLDDVGGGERDDWQISEAWLPESCVRQWGAEITVALGRLHSLGITCRDLRPDNLLLGDRGHVILTYFSEWSCVDRAVNQYALDNLYCAPEVSSVFEVTQACDWWSLGAIIFELLTGRTVRQYHPAGITQHCLVQVPQCLSSEAQSLLTELLRYSPTERLGGGGRGFEEVRAHPFFSTVEWNSLIG